MTITLIVKDDAGNEVMTVHGPTLPAASVTLPGTAKPNADLVLKAFTRMYGFYR